MCPLETHVSRRGHVYALPTLQLATFKVLEGSSLRDREALGPKMKKEERAKMTRSLRATLPCAHSQCHSST